MRDISVAGGSVDLGILVELWYGTRFQPRVLVLRVLRALSGSSLGSLDGGGGRACEVRGQSDPYLLILYALRSHTRHLTSITRPRSIDQGWYRFLTVNREP